MKTAHFICTEKDNDEIILMGFMNKCEKMEKIYNAFYESDIFETLYMKVAPITYTNEKYVVDL